MLCESCEEEELCRTSQKAKFMREDEFPGAWQLLNAHSLISLSRQYAGMAEAPFPLSLNVIDSFLSVHQILSDRTEFRMAIFALDDAWQEKRTAEQKSSSKK